jgi:CBS domain-containing protein
MQVKELLNGKLEAVGPESTLQNAAEKMKLNDQRLLPVWGGARLVGVITESGIVGACAEGHDPIRVRVREV